MDREEIYEEVLVGGEGEEGEFGGQEGVCGDVVENLGNEGVG